MGLKLSNNATSTLTSSISNSATSLTVQSGDAGRFPALSANDWFPLTVTDSNGNHEVMRATARAGAVITVQRAQEGTSAIPFAAGSRVDLRPTAAALLGTASSEIDDAATKTSPANNDVFGFLDSTANYIMKKLTWSSILARLDPRYLRTSGVFSRLSMPAGAKIRTATGAISQGLEIYQSTAASDAMVTFHVGADFACHFGLSGNLNDIAVGGWSMGGVEYRIWHAGNDGAGSGLHADLLDGLHASQMLRTDVSDNVNATTEWQDNKEIRMGNDADWRQFYNGSHAYLRNYKGNVYLESYAHAAEWLFRGEDSGGVMNNLIVLQDNLYCRFYYDNSEKMRTDGSGVTVYGRLHANDRMYVGSAGSGDSILDFHDDNSDTWRSLWWDDSDNALKAEENDGGHHKLALVDGSSATGHTSFPIGHPLIASYNTTQPDRNGSRALYLYTGNNDQYVDSSAAASTKGAQLSGTWRASGVAGSGTALYRKVA